MTSIQRLKKIMVELPLFNRNKNNLLFKKRKEKFLHIAKFIQSLQPGDIFNRTNYNSIISNISLELRANLDIYKIKLFAPDDLKNKEPVNIWLIINSKTSEIMAISHNDELFINIIKEILCPLLADKGQK